MQMQAFRVAVPPGHGPGKQFHANINGQLVAVTVPQGVQPGQQLQIQVPVQQMAVATAQRMPQDLAAAQAAKKAAAAERAAAQAAERAAAQAPRQFGVPQAPQQHAARKLGAVAQMQRQKTRERLTAAANQPKSMLDEMQAQRSAEAQQRERQHEAARGGASATAHLRTGAPPRAASPQREISALWWLNMGI